MYESTGDGASFGSLIESIETSSDGEYQFTALYNSNVAVKIDTSSIIDFVSASSIFKVYRPLGNNFIDQDFFVEIESATTGGIEYCLTSSVKSGDGSVTQVLGCDGDAHGPDEKLHIPTAKRLTAVIAAVSRTVGA